MSSGLAQKLIEALATVIQGRRDTIELVVTALLADGHALLEDFPGSGKTTLAKTLGKLLSKGQDNQTEILTFRRIQFTPDMLPSDVLGVNIFDINSNSFQFIHGPIFAHIVLADEINRTGPKVQAAFLECMAEKQVTIDNKTHLLHPVFFVLGTQNPIEFAGTYALPLVQLDRFLLKIPMSYVDNATELAILESHSRIEHDSNNLTPVASVDEVIKARLEVKKVKVANTIRQAIVDILQATRNSPSIEIGASTRAGLMLQAAIKAWAYVQGRDFCTEDDLKFIAPYVLLHRLKFNSSLSSPKVLLTQVIEKPLEELIRKGLN
jgi:MoxR-like ATPase